MFVLDPLNRGLELLAQRELQGAEHLFLRVVNDPYAQSEDTTLARRLLNDIRACQSGKAVLDFEVYRKFARKSAVSLAPVYECLTDVYLSQVRNYPDIDREIENRLSSAVNRLKQIKIRDIIARDELFDSIEKKSVQAIKRALAEKSGAPPEAAEFEPYRWKTVFRKFIRQINPILLERHLEMLEYVLESGDMEAFDDAKLTVLTAKCRWIIESTLKSKWYLLRSYFFKARSEVQSQFVKKEGTRKYWEDVKYKKVEIFEHYGFHERHIQKFLYIDKLNYKTLEEIHQFARKLGLALIPRDVSLALRGVTKAKNHIQERAGHLFGVRREFQEQLLGLGFSKDNAYKIARQAKQAHCRQIVASFERSLQVARDEIYWYRVPPATPKLMQDLETQCCKHLSTVRIHLFDRGRLNKLLLQTGKRLIREYLIRAYGESVVRLHCYFRLETVHQYYKLKFFQHHAQQAPSVSELIKISREDFKPILLAGYAAFLKKRRIVIPSSLYQSIREHRSATSWEDEYATPEEKILLRCWFLMDHGVPITQGLINKGVLSPGYDLWKFLNTQEAECRI
jgi:hypothetical protein